MKKESLNLLIETLGLKNKKDVTVAQIESSREDTKELKLVEGEWNSSEPWFVVDDSGNTRVAVTDRMLKTLLVSLQKSQEESLRLALEREIMQYMPLDFDDVWVVAMDEIKKKISTRKQKQLSQDEMSETIRSIRKKHPNLFLDIQDMMDEDIDEE